MRVQRQRTASKALFRGEGHDQLAAGARRQLALIEFDVSGLKWRKVRLVLSLDDEHLGLPQCSGSGERERQGRASQRD
jgi:hypothetical protein